MTARRSLRSPSRLPLSVLACVFAFSVAQANDGDQEGGGGPRSRAVPAQPSKPWPACVSPTDLPTSPLPLWDFRSYYLNPAFHLAGYKDEEGIDDYLGCWKQSSEFHRLYLAKYKPWIKAAAESAGVPFQILACLFFYESKFDREIVSPVGAQGMAQIMPSTWKTIVGNLKKKAIVANPYILGNLKQHLPAKGGTAIAAAVGRLQAFFDGLEPDPKKRAANREKGVNPSVTGKANLEKFRSLLRDLSRYEAFAEAASVAQYVTNADSALERIQSQEIYDKYLRRIGKSSIVLDPFSAEAAAIIGAITLKVDVFQGVFGHEYRYGSQDRWIIAAGGYNSGPGGIKCKPDATAEECIRATNNAETKKHMRGIKNCSEHGNWKNKEDGAHPKGCVG